MLLIIWIAPLCSLFIGKTHKYCMKYLHSLFNIFSVPRFAFFTLAGCCCPFVIYPFFRYLSNATAGECPMKIYFLTIGLVKRLQCTYALYKSSRLMVNSFPELSLIPIIIFAVTCRRMYRMPVALTISLRPMSFSLISSLVSEARGSGSQTRGLRPGFLRGVACGVSS